MDSQNLVKQRLHVFVTYIVDYSIPNDTDIEEIKVFMDKDEREMAEYVKETKLKIENYSGGWTGENEMKLTYYRECSTGEMRWTEIPRAWKE
jgi:hypothetical protein